MWLDDLNIIFYREKIMSPLYMYVQGICCANEIFKNMGSS